MDSKLLNYIRKNYQWSIPGKKEAMQYFRAAYQPMNRNWPDYAEIEALKRRYSKSELEALYNNWEDDFEEVAEKFYSQNKDKLIINRCPLCNEITYTIGSERCGECGHTWYGQNPHRGHS